MLSLHDIPRICRTLPRAKTRFATVVRALKNGMVVLDEFIRCDEEQTGRTMIGREGLADLMRLAQQRPRPFDCILIDDTSRLGRNLPDVLRICDTFMLYGVFIYFVSDRLDSRDESFTNRTSCQRLRR